MTLVAWRSLESLWVLCKDYKGNRDYIKYTSEGFSGFRLSAAEGLEIKVKLRFRGLRV